jgi:DNA-directed RNA polymerase specialized sigma24 family protein
MGEDIEYESVGGEDVNMRRDAYLQKVEGVLDPAYRLATMLLGDYAAAEQAVHDTTLRAWGEYRRVGGNVTSFRTWFLSHVVRHCRRGRWWRRLTRRPGEAVTGATRLEHALLRLPDEHRAALFCHHFLRLPHDEAARVLGIPSAAKVRMLVHRIAERLEPDLEPDDEPAHA